jgi:DNA-binding NarL/FixJ family response regulator
MRVVVADDALLTREGIVHVLEQAGIDIVGQAADSHELLELVSRCSPDVAVVDIKMPPTFTDEGLVAAQSIRSTHPDVAVLVLSQHIEPTYALRLLETYPERVGYLLKERVFAATVLVDAIRRVHEGDCVVDPTIVATLLGRRRRHDPLAELSGREREVLSLVAEGQTNKAIARHLYVTERTVEAHVSQIFLKLRLDENLDSNRRVLAVLTFLRA